MKTAAGLQRMTPSDCSEQLLAHACTKPVSAKDKAPRLCWAWLPQAQDRYTSWGSTREVHKAGGPGRSHSKRSSPTP